ncbi:DUF3300 domain-containing protein [Thioalkalivibrio sp. XN279]|uniref:DUF3300 domain-containing protein n=1 Tax=Thioalkalivibrio sp. XN279 TaxID=2714953 RepID=UPI00140E107F|nr:DUF3300 domain-containing protein [Thioalkalivibrio sp. XN279]NHA14701.1 DUF3300 domain-containing protein [Thioalkalivibrio sp. XN279]
MNRTRTAATTFIAMLGLAFVAVPAQAQEYVVEPIVDEPGLAGENALFTEAELDQLLAPIALYPDALLSQVLIAATYPLEIVAAARWSRANPGLDGEAAVQAVAEEDWDPSVKSLVAFPDLLAQMDQDLEWTRQLGEAMLLQESDVMDSIQFLRAKADEAGSLQDTEQVRVVREERTIVIEPARERIVYIPYYDTRVVYGNWWRPAYPPVYWPRPSYYTYYGSTGFYWSSGIHVATGFFYSDFYWPSRNVVIVRAPRYYYPPRHYYGAQRYYVPGERWKHNPWHRRSVKYRHHELRKRYEPHIRPPSVRYSESRAERRGAPQTGQRFGSSTTRQEQSQQRSAPRNYRESNDPARVERQLRTERQQRAERQPRLERPERTASAPLQRRIETATQRSQRPAQPNPRQSQSYRATRQQAQVQRAQPSARAHAPARQAAATRSAAPSRQAAPSPRAAPARQAAPTRQAAPARQAQSRPSRAKSDSSSRGRAQAPQVRRGNSGADSRLRRQVN